LKGLKANKDEKLLKFHICIYKLVCQSISSTVGLPWEVFGPAPVAGFAPVYEYTLWIIGCHFDSSSFNLVL